MQVIVAEQQLESPQSPTATITTTTITAAATRRPETNMELTTNHHHHHQHSSSSSVHLKLVEQIQKLLHNANGKEQHPNVKCPSANQTANDCIPTATSAVTTTSAVDDGVYYPGISQLLPSLFLCGAYVAMPHILDRLGVSFIVNVAPELPDTPLSSTTKPLYLRVDALDRADVDLLQHFDEVADMIEEVRQSGGISLVHCVAGVSRSATLCLAYLMKHMGMSLRTAYQHVKAARPEIRPNSGFFAQLRRYEEQIHGECSVRMVFYESLNKEIPDVYETEYKAMELFYQRQRQALRNR